MKKVRRMLSFALAIALLSVSHAALAQNPAPASHAVSARQWSGMVWVSGTEAKCVNEAGRPAELVAYNGTVYIPLRTAGEWMGCQVAWNRENQSVVLTSGGEDSALIRDDAPALTEEELSVWLHSQEYGMDITLRPDLAVLLDGKELSFANAEGEPVYPAVYRQVTYLPVRSIGELCGCTVTWVPGEPGRSPDRIYLRSPLTDAELEEIQAFLTAAGPLGDALEETVQAMFSHQTADSTAFLSCVTALTEYISSLRALARPSADWAQPAVSALFGTALSEMERAAARCLTSLEQDPASYASLQSDQQLHDIMFEGCLCVQESLIQLEQSVLDLL